MTGKDLKIRRIIADVRIKELAQEMGVTGSRVTHIEKQALVSVEATAKYLDALTTCSTKTTGTGEAA